MSLIKDGNVYRTEYEQIVHLTKKHLEQLNINENVSKQLQELSIAANLGGYNLVRFSFQKSGTFYKFKNSIINIPVYPTTEAEGDFVEFTNGKPDEIPAYGYFINNHQIELYFLGDFKEAYDSIKAYNITKNITYDIALSNAFDTFEGTSLLDYDPNNVKKQVFNVLTDIIYFDAKTQYVSFDINSDNKYNFVYIGNIKDGVNGKNVYTISDISDYNNIVNTLIPGDTLLCGNNITINNTNYSIGTLLQFNSINDIVFKGNIRGSSGKDYIFLKNVQSIDIVTDNIYIKANELSRYPENFTTEYVIGNVYDTQNNSWLVNYQIIGNAGASDTYELKPISYNRTTGIQGPIGPEGPVGPEGPQGIQGPSGITLSLQTGLYNSPSDLPAFSSVPVFNAYRVQNTSGTIVTTDLYFKTEGATDWDIQENWGGIPGPQGNQGPTGKTPNIQIGKVTTGAAGSKAQASITGTVDNPLLNLTIPKGDTGAQGDTGATGDPGPNSVEEISVTASGCLTNSSICSYIINDYLIIHLSGIIASDNSNQPILSFQNTNRNHIGEAKSYNGIYVYNSLNKNIPITCSLNSYGQTIITQNLWNYRGYRIEGNLFIPLLSKTQAISVLNSKILIDNETLSKIKAFSLS